MTVFIYHLTSAFLDRLHTRVAEGLVLVTAVTALFGTNLPASFSKSLGLSQEVIYQSHQTTMAS